MHMNQLAACSLCEVLAILKHHRRTSSGVSARCTSSGVLPLCRSICTRPWFVRGLEWNCSFPLLSASSVARCHRIACTKSGVCIAAMFTRPDSRSCARSWKTSHLSSGQRASYSAARCLAGGEDAAAACRRAHIRREDLLHPRAARSARSRRALRVCRQ